MGDPIPQENSIFESYLSSSFLDASKLIQKFDKANPSQGFIFNRSHSSIGLSRLMEALTKWNEFEHFVRASKLGDVNAFIFADDAAGNLGSSMVVRGSISRDESRANSSEAIGNGARENFIKAKLYQSIADDYFDSGEMSKSETVISRMVKLHPDQTRDAVSQIFYEQYQSKDPKHLIGLLKSIRVLQHSEIAPVGPVIAIAALMHVDLEVNEAAIMCFEGWRNREALNALRNVRAQDPWLRKYIEKVISEISSELCAVT